MKTIENNFQTTFKEKQKKVDAFLEQALPSEKTPPEIIHKALRYSVLAGGKRIRPILCLASCEALGENEDIAIPFACAIELIHTYSLIHDDLPCMDNDDFRRGRPTSHKVFGEAIAVLAGDALLTLAFNWMAHAENILPELKIRAIQDIATASGTQGLVGGQVADLTFQGQEIDAEKLLYIHTHKTARLIEASVKAGAIIGEVSESSLKALSQYGLNIGLAFQITDDLLDVTGNADKMGKAVGKDAQLAKATYPGLFGVEVSRQMAKECIQKALQAIDFLENKGNFLRGISTLIQERQS
jgi:geranylgeranyl diphosphate synthase type II